MNEKNLKMFMRESVKSGELISVPGPDTIKDESGQTVELEFRVMSLEEQEKIRKGHEKKTIAHDKNGKPIIDGGDVVFVSDADTLKAVRHMLVESLVYPDLKDPELMKFFDCIDITEMPNKVFTRGELDYVVRQFNAVHGIKTKGEQEAGQENQDGNDIDELKN